MPRRPRIEFAGATYHLINRGHEGRQIFGQSGPAETFERLLFEAAERCGWILFAYCLMGNHYHLALKTPKGNLVEGMQWMQSTFATRFKERFRQPGEVFHDRYRAILVEPGLPLAQLVHFIHLNPVRAGLRSVYNLESYRWSSLPKYLSGTERPASLQTAEWLPHLGQGFNWENYRDQLAAEMDLYPADREKVVQAMCRSAVIGSEPFREKIRAKFKTLAVAGNSGRAELKDQNEAEWEREAARCLARLGKTAADIASDRKSAEWKAAVAYFLKRRTSVSNPWLSRRLNMGPPAMVSRLASAFAELPGETRARYERKMLRRR